jgi:SRSO17 transposase
MLERTLRAGVPFGWVTGDEVYGGDRRLRLWLEAQDLAHLLAIKATEPLWAATDRGPAQVAAADLIAGLPADAWSTRSAGDGAKGPRRYDWAWLPIRPLRAPGTGYWLLARRSRSDPTDLAYYVGFGPAETPLAELVRVAGTRWAIETCFEEAKGEVGLDEYEVRRWDGWHRHVTLGLLAHAVLAVTRAATVKRGAPTTR